MITAIECGGKWSGSCKSNLKERADGWGRISTKTWLWEIVGGRVHQALDKAFSFLAAFNDHATEQASTVTMTEVHLSSSEVVVDRAGGLVLQAGRRGVIDSLE